METRVAVMSIIVENAEAVEKINALLHESSEYIIRIEGTTGYDLSLDFIEKPDTEKMTLKKYAYVKVIANEEILCDKLLSAAFESDEILLHIEPTTGEKTEVSVIFYLPINIGNEAEGAEADFDLLIKASNE